MKTDQARRAPLYRQLMETLKQRIEQGVYPVGAALPAESELCAEFGISRYTVREALRRLVDYGMITRWQGSGSTVVSADAAPVYVQSMRSLSELFQYALDTRFDIRSMEPIAVDRKTAALIPAAAGSTWLRIDGVRIRPVSGEPICYTTVYVADRFRRFAPEMRKTPGPIYALIEERSGEPVAEAIQEISGAPMTRQIAGELGLPARSYALRFTRRYIGEDGAPMLTSVNWHPADRFVYQLRLRRTEIGEG